MRLYRELVRLSGAFGLPAFALALVLSPFGAEAQTRPIGLGSLDPTDPYTVALGISADGSTVVGYSYDGSDVIPFYWTAPGGIQSLGFSGCACAMAYAVNADGSVIVGSNNGEAFRWTNGSVEMLGFFDNAGIDFSEALGVNADGSVIVGYSASAIGLEAFRWVDGPVPQMQNLGNLGIPLSKANGVSADGTVVVGDSLNADGYNEAFRWEEGKGPMQGLGFLDATDTFHLSSANAVSGNGEVIVGLSRNEFGRYEAFRWKDGTMVGLGFLDESQPDSEAFAVNRDGSVIVGMSYNGSDYDAFRWADDGRGMRSIEDILTEDGVDLGNWDLLEATGVSGDGLTITGNGIDPNGEIQAWIVRGLGFITVQNGMQSLASLGMAAQGMQDFIGGNLQTQQEYALQHATTAYVPVAPMGYAEDLGANFPNIKHKAPDFDRWRAFTYGEVHGGDESEHGTGQGGLSYNFTNYGVVGAALGAGASSTDLAFGGESEFFGAVGSVFAAYAPPTGFQAIFSASGTAVDADISRGYLNGVTEVTSDGETEGVAYGALLRLGYAFALTGKTSLTPFGSFQATRVELDGYTETTGPFPAVIDDIDETVGVSRLGLEAKYAYSGQTWLWGSAAWAHRTDDDGAAVSAQLIGLFGISGSTLTVDQDWAEATAGVSHGFGDGLSRISASATAYVPGEDVSVTGRVGFSRAF